ncbi:MAG: TIGR03936 family radical SAM-associated protein [Eubacteriales bacterium]|nr:TIGR03936 family radical SAM-associated protein [Eubacteriales bacterium]
MLPVRVFFRKKGGAVYISHLDLQRAVFRAINRSGVKAVYTEGFNPHIKIAFAAPLSVFQKSEYEIFDFYAEDDMSCEEITSRLASAFPEGLEIIEAAMPIKKQKELALADYEIVFETPLTAAEMEKLLSGAITVIKKSKKGDHPEDISHMIKSKHFVQIGNNVKACLRCSCGSGEHLNVRYIADFLGDNITGYDITRKSLLDAEGNDLR